MLKKIFIGLGILVGLGILGAIIYIIMFLAAFGVFDKDYSVTELKSNFEKNKTEIYALKKYFNNIVPKNKQVEIEFENNRTLFRFGIYPLDTTPMSKNGFNFLEWDLKINSKKMDSIIKIIGWSRETLKMIKEKLDKAACISIESGEPAKIGFKRSGLGKYYFNVYDKPISDSIKSTLNDSSNYIFGNDKMILEYGGGAIGPQSFYNKK